MKMMTCDLGTVLSVTTGILLTRNFGDVHRLMDHLTGDTLFTHQLSRAFKPCKVALLAQFPRLADVTPPANVGEILDAWLETESVLHGNSFDVVPMAPDAWERRPPLEELQSMMRPDQEMVAVVVG